MRKPLCIDGFCGLGGWADGFLAEGWDVIGFDIEQRPYPGQLVLQDMLTIHGSQFKGADCLVFSPPCQEYSYMAQPWKRGKRIAAVLRHGGVFPTGYIGSGTIKELNALFDACFRIQREASETAGREIPMVVENVKGAQPWVGRAKARYGSFFLWGSVESIGGRIVRSGDLRFGVPSVKAAARGSRKSTNPVNIPDWQKEFGLPREPDPHPIRYGDGQNPDGRKLGPCPGKRWNERPQGDVSAHREGNGRKVPMNFHEHEKTGKPGRSFQSVAVAEGAKGFEGGLGRGHGHDPARRFNSKSPRRAQASAEIAKIPFPLAQHIARVFKPS